MEEFVSSKGSVGAVKMLAAHTHTSLKDLLNFGSTQKIRETRIIDSLLQPQLRSHSQMSDISRNRNLTWQLHTPTGISRCSSCFVLSWLWRLCYQLGISNFSPSFRMTGASHIKRVVAPARLSPHTSSQVLRHPASPSAAWLAGQPEGDLGWSPPSRRWWMKPLFDIVLSGAVR